MKGEVPEPLFQALGSMRKTGTGLVSSGLRTLHHLSFAARRDWAASGRVAGQVSWAGPSPKQRSRCGPHGKRGVGTCGPLGHNAHIGLGLGLYVLSANTICLPAHVQLSWVTTL